MPTPPLPEQPGHTPAREYSTPLDALSDMIDVYDSIAGVLADRGSGWDGFRSKHLEEMFEKVRMARLVRDNLRRPLAPKKFVERTLFPTMELGNDV